MKIEDIDFDKLYEVLMSSKVRMSPTAYQDVQNLNGNSDEILGDLYIYKALCVIYGDLDPLNDVFSKVYDVLNELYPGFVREMVEKANLVS